MMSSCSKFQGKCHHCGKYGHREMNCWEKHGRPGNNQDQNNQAAEDEDEDEQEEEVALVGFSLRDDDEPQDDQEPD